MAARGEPRLGRQRRRRPRRRVRRRCRLHHRLARRSRPAAGQRRNRRLDHQRRTSSTRAEPRARSAWRSPTSTATGRLDVVEAQGEVARARGRARLPRDRRARPGQRCRRSSASRSSAHRSWRRVHDNRTPNMPDDWQSVTVPWDGGRAPMTWYGENLFPACPRCQTQVCASRRRKPDSPELEHVLVSAHERQPLGPRRPDAGRHPQRTPDGGRAQAAPRQAGHPPRRDHAHRRRGLAADQPVRPGVRGAGRRQRYGGRAAGAEPARGAVHPRRQPDPGLPAYVAAPAGLARRPRLRHQRRRDHHADRGPGLRRAGARAAGEVPGAQAGAHHRPGAGGARARRQGPGRRGRQVRPRSRSRPSSWRPTT